MRSSEQAYALRGQFEALAFDYMDRLYRAALYLTKDKRDAEELVQETYLKAFRFFASFREGTNFRAWLFKILHNNFYSHYRLRRRRPPRVDFALVERQQGAQSYPEAAEPRSGAFRDLFDDEISHALARLPTVYRAALLLVDVNGLSYQEAASILNCPIGTVMSRLARGRRRLRWLLRTYEA